MVDFLTAKEIFKMENAVKEKTVTPEEETPSHNNSFKERMKDVKSFFMKTTNGMAIGLFGTLIIGTVLNLFAKIPYMEQMGTWAKVVQGLLGAGIGLGVALSLKQNGVMVVAMMAAGYIGNYEFEWLPNNAKLAQYNVGSIGDPLSCYVAAILAYAIVKLVMRKKTPVDLILIPLVGLLAAIAYSFLLAEWIHYITIGISALIKVSFAAVPFLMCIIVSVLVGMALTAPISSVAICVAINIGSVPLAAASALIGCCVEMVGFAVETARDNKWGSVLAVGLGTSMLQFKNIIRKPIVWLPTIIASAILGPFALLFPMKSLAEGYSISALSVSAGMGTSGLVGPLNLFGVVGWGSGITWALVILVCIIAPIALVFGLDLLFRKLGWIEKGDFSLTADI